MRKRISTLSRPLQLLAAVGVLVLALGGTATASRLITGHDIRNNSITGADIKAGSLDRSDLNGAARTSLQGKAGAIGATGATGARGAPGAAGAAGAMGATGTAGINGANGTDAVVIFASVPADGLTLGASRNVEASVIHAVTGAYTLTAKPLVGVSRPDLTKCVAMVQTHPVTGGTSGEATLAAGGQIDVTTFAQLPNGGGNPAVQDHDFVVTVSC